MSSFPRFSSHETAQCYNCGLPLAGVPREDYADGEGRFSQACVACGGRRTWYDLTRGARPAVDARGEEA